MTELSEEADREKIGKICLSIHKTCEEVDSSVIELLMSLEIIVTSVLCQENSPIDARKELWKFFIRTSELLDKLYSEKVTNQNE